MIDESTKAMILMGEDVEIHGITIRNYKLREIFKDIGLDVYREQSMFCILRLEDILPKEVMELDEMKHFTLQDAIIHIEPIRNRFLEFLNFFTYEKWIFNQELEEFITSFNKDRLSITKGTITDIFELVQYMYCIKRIEKESDSIKPVNDEVAQAFKEFDEWCESLPKDAPTITLNSIVVGITSNKNSNYTLFNIYDLTMYQLFATYYGIEQVDNFSFTMSGIYAGTVDSKGIKDLHWAKEIDML